MNKYKCPRKLSRFAKGAGNVRVIAASGEDASLIFFMS